jgi:hypothetical protein
MINGEAFSLFQHWHYAPVSDWHEILNGVDWPIRYLARDRGKVISPMQV